MWRSPGARATQRCRPHLPLTSGRSPSGHLEAILSAPRRLQEASKVTFFGSRSLQERSKRLPRGFLRAPASKMRFGSHFGPTLASKKRAWDLKNQEHVVRHPTIFETLQLSAWITFGPRFGPLLGPFWVPIWPPGNSKPVSLVPLGRPRADPNNVFWAPKAPRAFQEAAKRPPTCQDNSKSSPRGPKTDVRAVLEPFWG